VGLAHAIGPWLPAPAPVAGGGFQWSQPQSGPWSDLSPRTWAAGGNGVKAVEGVAVRGAWGSLGATVTEAVSMRGAVLAVTRCAANPICILGTQVAIMAAKSMMDSYRVKHPGQVPGEIACGFDGCVDVDPGQDPASVVVSCWWGFANTECFGGPVAAADNYGCKINRCGGPGSSVCTATADPALQNCVLHYNGTDTYGVQVKKRQGQGSTCPASVDVLDPQYSIPSGSPIGPDGKCPTARYNHKGMTPDQAADAIMASNPPPTPTQPWVDAVSGAVDKGGQQTGPSSITSSGPASITGTPTTTTTTGPDGRPTTKVETPSWTFNYPGDQITVGTGLQTDTTPQGGPTSTTTTTTSGGGSPKSDPADPCLANPTRVGCMDIGDPPTDKVPKSNKAVPGFTPDPINLPASCPPPEMVTIHGQPQAVSYQPACDAAVKMAPWIKAGAALTALMICFGAFKAM